MMKAMIGMKKHKTPLRQCILTREQLPKGSMIRVVKNKENDVFVDPTGKAHGRGAYVKKDINVIKKAQKQKALNKHFGLDVDPQVYEDLLDAIKR